MAARRQDTRRHEGQEAISNSEGGSRSRGGAKGKPRPASADEAVKTLAEGIRREREDNRAIREAITIEAGHQHPSLVTAKDVAAIAARFIGKSSAYRRSVHSHIRRLLRNAGVPEEALLGLPHIWAVRPREVTVPEETFESTLRHATPSCFFAMMLAHEAALRLGTIRQLTSENVDTEAGVMYGRTKGSSSYRVPMTVRLRSYIGTLIGRAAGPDEPLINQLNKGRTTPLQQTLNTALDRAQKAAAVPGGWSYHDLRRTAARRLYDRTHDIRKVQRLLSHANPAQTLWYLGNIPAELTAEDLEEQAAKREEKAG